MYLLCNPWMIVWIFTKPDIVIHAAATKFVDLSEKFPFECIDINIVGSANIARACINKKFQL